MNSKVGHSKPQGLLTANKSGPARRDEYSKYLKLHLVKLTVKK